MMGNLTPILIRNDSVHAFLDKKMHQQICESIYQACMLRESSTISFHFPKGGIDCNPIESLGYRHADESGIILFSGNTWIDLNKFAYSNRPLNDTYIAYIEKCLKFARRDIAHMAKRIKELKSKKK